MKFSFLLRYVLEPVSNVRWEIKMRQRRNEEKKKNVSIIIANN
jgi:hypothetical protein